MFLIILTNWEVYAQIKVVNIYTQKNTCDTWCFLRTNVDGIASIFQIVQRRAKI